MAEVSYVSVGSEKHRTRLPFYFLFRHVRLARWGKGLSCEKNLQSSGNIFLIFKRSHWKKVKKEENVSFLLLIRGIFTKKKIKGHVSNVQVPILVETVTKHVEISMKFSVLFIYLTEYFFLFHSHQYCNFDLFPSENKFCLWPLIDQVPICPLLPVVYFVIFSY